MALVLNLFSSGWQMLIIRLMEGDDGLACAAALNREAVTRPVLMLNHKVEPDCCLVLASTTSAS